LQRLQDFGDLLLTSGKRFPSLAFGVRFKRLWRVKRARLSNHQFQKHIRRPKSLVCIFKN
jgi:hypothetical protein